MVFTFANSPKVIGLGLEFPENSGEIYLVKELPKQAEDDEEYVRAMKAAEKEGKSSLLPLHHFLASLASHSNASIVNQSQTTSDPKAIEERNDSKQKVIENLPSKASSSAPPTPSPQINESPSLLPTSMGDMAPIPLSTDTSSPTAHPSLPSQIASDIEKRLFHLSSEHLKYQELFYSFEKLYVKSFERNRLLLALLEDREHRLSDALHLLEAYNQSPLQYGRDMVIQGEGRRNSDYQEISSHVPPNGLIETSVPSSVTQALDIPSDALIPLRELTQQEKDIALDSPLPSHQISLEPSSTSVILDISSTQPESCGSPLHSRLGEPHHQTSPSLASTSPSSEIAATNPPTLPSPPTLKEFKANAPQLASAPGVSSKFLESLLPASNATSHPIEPHHLTSTHEKDWKETETLQSTLIEAGKDAKDFPLGLSTHQGEFQPKEPVNRSPRLTSTFSTRFGDLGWNLRAQASILESLNKFLVYGQNSSIHLQRRLQDIYQGVYPTHALKGGLNDLMRPKDAFQINAGKVSFPTSSLLAHQFDSQFDSQSPCTYRPLPSRDLPSPGSNGFVQHNFGAPLAPSAPQPSSHLHYSAATGPSTHYSGGEHGTKAARSPIDSTSHYTLSPSPAPPLRLDLRQPPTLPRDYASLSLSEHDQDRDANFYNPIYCPSFYSSVVSSLPSSYSNGLDSYNEAF